MAPGYQGWLQVLNQLAGTKGLGELAAVNSWATYNGMLNSYAGPQGKLNMWLKFADAVGASTAVDSSGNGHSAALTAVTLGVTPGPFPGNAAETAASFNGTSSEANTSYNPSGMAAITTIVWIKAPATAGMVMSNDHTDGDFKGMKCYWNGSEYQVNYGNGSSNVEVNSASLAANTWHMCAVPWNSTTVSMYTDGAFVTSSALAGSIAAGTNNIGIGWWNALGSTWFTGDIAQVSIISAALTATQIKNLYNAAPYSAAGQNGLLYCLNRIAGTSGLGINAVCNVIAGTTGLEALHALNILAGNGAP
jgi:hypothetical protein